MTSRRLLIASFNTLPLPLFALLAFLAVRAHGRQVDPEARLQEDMADITTSSADRGTVLVKQTSLSQSAKKLKKNGRKAAYYPHPPAGELKFSPYGWSRYGPSGVSGYRQPPELNFSPYGWMSYGPSGRQ